MTWPFKRKPPPKPELIPWGEFVKTHLLPIARTHGIKVEEMSWEEATRAGELLRREYDNEGLQ
jgi:hypothetical protein